MNSKVFAFQYCENTWDSFPCTISLHWSREKAEEAKEAHKALKLEEFNNLIAEYKELDLDISNLIFGEDSTWSVCELTIEE